MKNFHTSDFSQKLDAEIKRINNESLKLTLVFIGGCFFAFALGFWLAFTIFSN